MPLTFPDNPQIGQTIEYSFTHPNLGGETGDEVTRLWTWNGPTMGWVSNGTRQLDYITRTEAIDIFVNESGDTMTGTLIGTDIYLHGSLSADKGFRESGDPNFQDNEFITKQYGEDIYVNESGDTMTGTLTGTDISLTGSLSAAGPIFVSKGFRRSVEPEFQNNEFITKQYGEDNFTIGATGIFSGGFRITISVVGAYPQYTINPMSDIGFPGPYSMSLTTFWRNTNGYSISAPSGGVIYNVFPGSENFKIVTGWSGGLTIDEDTRIIRIGNGSWNYGTGRILSIGPYREQ